MHPTLDDLRRYTVARTLGAPTTLPRAIERLGFVQADPIRAPARAQDLTLRHRVRNYRAGDLERRYPRLDVEEDFFVNYGFLPRATQALMHPRTARTVWPEARRRQAEAVLAFVRERGQVHPREVDAHFQHGKARNWFGGSSNASTQLLDGMHYRGMLRIAAREGGVRVYAERSVHEPAGPPQGRTPQGAARRYTGEPAEPDTALDALVDVIVGQYAPLPARTLSELVARLQYATPQWTDRRAAALARAKVRLAHARIDGVDWYWPPDESPRSRRHAPGETVRLLAPFDPLVWDRRRFELLWGWAYRFEAYTPAAQRLRGYYALPLLWRDQVIGWANLGWRGGELTHDLGYVAGHAPTDAGFAGALARELDAMQAFLRPRGTTDAGS